MRSHPCRGTVLRNFTFPLWTCSQFNLKSSEKLQAFCLAATIICALIAPRQTLDIIRPNAKPRSQHSSNSVFAAIKRMSSRDERAFAVKSSKKHEMKWNIWFTRCHTKSLRLTCRMFDWSKTLTSYRYGGDTKLNERRLGGGATT